MPLNKNLQPLSGTCRYCGQQARIFQRDHPKCRETHRGGWQEMVSLVAQAATDHSKVRLEFHGATITSSRCSDSPSTAALLATMTPMMPNAFPKTQP